MRNKKDRGSVVEEKGGDRFCQCLSGLLDVDAVGNNEHPAWDELIYCTIASRFIAAVACADCGCRTCFRGLRAL